MYITANSVNEWTRSVIYPSARTAPRYLAERPTAATLFVRYRRRGCRRRQSARRV